MSASSVNERHAHQARVQRLAARLAEMNDGAGAGIGVHLELLNVVNEAYAQGYRDADPDNRLNMAMPDGSEVIMDGAGRVVAHVPPRTVLDGTVSGRFRTYVQGGHLHVWDIEKSETILMIEMPGTVAFNINRVTGHGNEPPEDQQLTQVAEEVRVRWAASRALPPPHYIVCLPHDFVDKIKFRLDGVVDDQGYAHAPAVAQARNVLAEEARMVFVDQLDAWTEWDAKKGWR